MAAKRTIPGFAGPRGTLHCRLTGVIRDGVQLVRQKGRYTPDPKAMKQLKAGADGELPAVQ